MPLPSEQELIITYLHTTIAMSLSLTQYPGYYPANHHQWSATQPQFPAMDSHQQSSQASEVLSWPNSATNKSSMWTTTSNTSAGSPSNPAYPVYPPQTSSTGSAASSSAPLGYQLGADALTSSTSPAISRSPPSSASPASSDTAAASAYSSMYPHPHIR